MDTKHSPIHALISVVLVFLIIWSKPAAAALPTQVAIDLDAVNTSQRIVYIVGSDFLQPYLPDITQALFSGTTVRFADVAFGVDRSYEAILGTVKTGGGDWSGQKALLIYRVKGGATAGIRPTILQQAIESLQVISSACGAIGSGTQLSPYQCPVTSGGSAKVPTALLTESNVAIANSFENTSGEEPPLEASFSELQSLQSIALFSRMEGVALTNTVNQDVKLNRAAIASIYAANVVNWNQVSRLEPANEDIVICLQTPGSGTRMTSNLFFNRVGCDQATSVARRTDNDVNFDGSPKWDPATKNYTIKRSSGTSTYIENSTAADVRSCLNTAVAGGTYTTGDRSGIRDVQVTFVGSGHRAIGILSLENLQHSVANGSWQFRSLNGAGKMTMNSGTPTTTGTGLFPTRENHFDGTWELTSIPQLSFSQNLTGARRQFLEFFAKAVGSPAFLANIGDGASRQAFAALPSTVVLPDGTFPLPSGTLGSSTNNTMTAAFSGYDQCRAYYKNY